MTTPLHQLGLDILRTEFPANQISYLPKGGVKLAYVGHAALTDRLLDADVAWSWEPLSIGANGLPVLDETGGLWIRLTVCGVTRLGYGDAGAKKGGDAMKERIGDALRNAAMRFGAALDLWHKGELHAHLEADDAPVSVPAVTTTRGGVMGAVLRDMPPMDADEAGFIGEIAVNAIDLHKAKGIVNAFDRIESEMLDNDQKTYLWNLLPSDLRSALKKEGEKRKVPA